METKPVEYELAMIGYRKEQRGMESLIDSISGKYGEPGKSAKGLRKSLAKKLAGVSVSQMIIDAR